MVAAEAEAALLQAQSLDLRFILFDVYENILEYINILQLNQSIGTHFVLKNHLQVSYSWFMTFSIILATQHQSWVHPEH